MEAVFYAIKNLDVPLFDWPTVKQHNFATSDGCLAFESAAYIGIANKTIFRLNPANQIFQLDIQPDEQKRFEKGERSAKTPAAPNPAINEEILSPTPPANPST